MPHKPLTGLKVTNCINGTTPVKRSGTNTVGAGGAHTPISNPFPIAIAEVPYSTSPDGPWKRMPITCTTVLGHLGTVCVFEQDFALEDAIGSHACSLEANMRVTKGIPLGSPLLLPFVTTVNCVETAKALAPSTTRHQCVVSGARFWTGFRTRGCHRVLSFTPLLHLKRCYACGKWLPPGCPLSLPIDTVKF
jgi:hypothetical protein